MPEQFPVNGSGRGSGENGRMNETIRVRIWPAVLISLAYFAVSYAFRVLGSTNIQSVLESGGVPLISTLLLIIWWLAASRAPKRDRWAGLGLFFAALAVVVFSQKPVSLGAMLLMLALPVIANGAVAVLLVTFWLRWPARRWLLAAFIVITTGIFCAQRVDSISGVLTPVVSWRWTPSAQEHSEALPQAEKDGTALLPEKTGAGDWPGFRGAARDSRVAGMRFPADWSTPPKEVWRQKIGPAWSSFAAVGDYLFTQEQRGAMEAVTCYQAATGKLVWINEIAARFEDTMGLGPRATPTFSEGKLFVQGCTGVLQCLDAATGKTIWKRDVTKDAETGVPVWGFSSSPLVVGELVVTFSGGGEGKNAIAYRRVTGDVAWRAGHAASAYSSPHFAVLAGTPQVLMASDFGIQAFAPETGAPLWEYEWKVKNNPRCVQPLLAGDDLVLLGTTGATGSRLLRIMKNDAAWKVEEEWLSKKFRPYFNDGVLHKRFLYGFDGERLACIDIESGERRWQGERYGGQLLLFEDMDMLLVLSEAGDLILIPAKPDRFVEAGHIKVLGGKTWNHPVAAHNRLYLRNAEEAVCLDLSAQ